MTSDYRYVASLMRQGGISGFFSRSLPFAEPNNLGHPPGYSILLAFIESCFGESNSAVQLTQIAADAFSVAIISLILAELISPLAAAIAGLLAAFSPQFAWNSVLLLPDSISVLPILLAIYLLVRGTQKPTWWKFAGIGVLVGISCWLRPNAMLLGLFMAAVVPLLIKQRRARGFALAVLGGVLIIILPLTIRNAIVFKRFIPLSLGAGQTLLEGIADYDEEGRFGIPRTDIGIMKQEAEQFQRPDYYHKLFNPDGVEREQLRLARGFGVIKSHPVWFAGVMLRRASSMVRLERTRLISIDPPPSHTINYSSLNPQRTITAAELAMTTDLSSQARIAYDPVTATLRLTGDESKYGPQIASSWSVVRQNTDHVFVVPVRIERGRMRISVVDRKGKVYSSSVIETHEHRGPEEQPLVAVELPFVSGASEPVHLVFSNEASDPPSPMGNIGTSELYELGDARFLWTRTPRFLVHAIQKIFLTAVMLPLAVMGIVALVVRRDYRPLIILSVVPIYFFTAQSALHTEYRYLLALNYFLLAFAAVGISWMVIGVINFVGRRSPKSRH